MTHFNESQVGSKDFSDYRGAKGIAGRFLEKVEPWPAGLQEGQTKENTK